MNLREQRVLFTRLISQFIVWVYETLPGYEIALGECERSKLQAQANAASGAGISNSLHTLGLAVDLHLYINGVYQTSSEAHTILGDKWKSMHSLNRWGGEFRKPDGNHYSSERDGVR